MQRFHSRLPFPPRLNHQFLDGLSHFERSRRGRQRLAEVYSHRIWNLPWEFPKKTALFETENAAPDTIQRNRNDGRIDVLHDSLKAALKWERKTDPGDLAFRKDAYDITILYCLAGRSK